MRILMNLMGDKTKASSRVRGYWIAEALEQRGHCVSLTQTARALDYPKFVADIWRHDATIIQKKYGRYDLIAAKAARGFGKHMYFDIDDAPSRIQSPKVEQNAQAMMRLSTGVFAGCKNLVDLAQNGDAHAHLIPTGVRCVNYRIKEHGPKDKVTLGWIGNGAHYADDLIRILSGPLQQLAQHHMLGFRLIGACGEQKLYDAFGAIENLEIDFIDTLNWADPDEIAVAMTPIDIGLYPLSDSHFNRFKCAFKALEYMASGLPVVASAVGANAETIQHGETGFLCSNDADWVAHVTTLVEDHDLRGRFGAHGRSLVEQNFDVTKLAEKIEAVLQSNI